MQKGSIVYISGRGFGITVPATNGGTRCDVLLRNAQEPQPLPANALELPAGFLARINDGEYRGWFSNEALTRAHQLLSEGSVKGIVLISDNRKRIFLSASVLDTVRRDVKAELRIYGLGNLYCGCHAPGACCHTAAMVLKLEAILMELYHKAGPAVETPDRYRIMEGPFELTEDMERLLNGMEGKRKDRLSHIRKITDRLRTAAAAQLLTFVNRAMAERSIPKTAKTELIGALVMCDETRVPMTRLVGSGVDISDALLPLYDKAMRQYEDVRLRSTRYADPDSVARYFFYNHRAKEMVDYISSFRYGVDVSNSLIEAQLQELIDAGNSETLLNACFAMSGLHSDPGMRRLAASMTSTLPDSRYLTAYLTNSDNRQQPLLTAPADPDESVDIDAIKRYFDTQYRVTEYDDHACVEFRVAPIGRKDAIPAVLFREDSNGRRTIQENRFDQRARSPIVDAISRDVRSRHGSEIGEALRTLEHKLRERNRAKELARLNSSVDDLLEAMPEDEPVLEETALADLEFCFEDGMRFGSSSSRGLELRLGHKRMYVIRDIAGFLRRFRTGESIQYGKSLLFSHRLCNIVAAKRPALELLLLCEQAGASFTRDGRYILLRDPLMGKLLLALKGCGISYNATDYMLRLATVPCHVELDRKCILHSSPAPKDATLLPLGDSLFLVNDEAHAIDLADADASHIRLYRFAAANDGCSMEPILERFNDEVYSRFYSDIEIADELRDRIRLSELEIAAHFDYAAGRITVRTSLLRDGDPVTEDSLTLPVDRSRVRGYRRYLEHMGFVDDVMEDDAHVLSFFTMDMSSLKKHCTVYLSESILGKKLQTLVPPAIRVERESNIMQAFLTGSEYSESELKAILAAIRKKKKFVLLRGDRIVDISDETAVRFEEAVEDLSLDKEHLLTPAPLSTAQALRAFAHESECRIDEYLYRMIEDIRTFKQSERPIPAVKAELRPYQAEGFRWLRTLADYHVGGILADDMGLGKTLQFITLLKSDEAPGPDLVVCPKSLVFNWVNEFRRFDPETRVTEIYGTAPARRELISSIDPSEHVVYVTSYDSLRNDFESYTCSFRYLILDEAQYIKNQGAQKSRTVKQLKAEHRFALTGTPIENSILDLWSLFEFIMPGYFDEISAFRSRYNRDDRFPAVVAKQIAPFVLRRTKRDVLKDLPDKYERILSVEMAPEQRKLYDAYKLEAAERLQNGANAFEVLPYLMRLRQLCDAPGMFVADYKGGSGKLDALSELLDSYLSDGHRMLIFSQFVQALSQVEALLNEKGIPYYRITGDTPAAERIELMNAFNRDEGVNVFLISLKAGGTGLNLTGADTVIHLDPWWNVAAEDQASDRAHRIGQTRNVEVIKLICENSVEQRVIELQNLKKDIIDKLISDNDSSVTSISLEDISFILK